VTDVVRRRHGPPGEPRRVAYLYVLPAFVFFAGFMAWPLLHGFWLSFYEWDGLSLGTWVGLDNYKSVVTDPELREPFLHSLVLLVFFSAIPIVLGLALAGVMMRARLRGMAFFRTVLFLPQVIAMVVVAIAWGHIYEPDGPLNDLLRTIGLDDLTRAWLGEPSWALVSVGVVGSWVGTGLCLVLFLAGLAKVPRELYESARLDGAGPVREFLSVGLPALRGELAVAMTLTMIAALRTFDLVYVMTPGGGPSGSTAVPSYEVYKRAFNDGEVGAAVTVAIVLTAIIMVITIGINAFADRGTKA
jgi:raffinose/stachyose/melibiose transport system permease protein